VLAESRAEFEEYYGFEDPPSGNNGWIAPNGKMWAVCCTTHSDFCEMWLGESEDVIEKIYVKLSDGEAYWEGKRLTKKQKNTLFRYGYDPEEVAKHGSAEREGYD